MPKYTIGVIGGSTGARRNEDQVRRVTALLSQSIEVPDKGFVLDGQEGFEFVFVWYHAERAKLRTEDDMGRVYRELNEAGADIALVFDARLTVVKRDEQINPPGDFGN